MLITGAGGFALQCLDILYLNAGIVDDLYFFDNVTKNLDNYISRNFRVFNSFEKINLTNKKFILGTGNPSTRSFFYSKFTLELGFEVESLISKNASISTINSNLDQGVTIMQGVVLMPNCQIGKGVLLNSNSTIGHDSKLGDFVEICPGANISGNCTIGKNVFIGTGAVVIPGINIGDDSVIAAGSIVLNDVPPKTLYAGNPAVFKKNI